MIYVQINKESNKLEQCVAFNDRQSLSAHCDANPQAFLVLVDRWCSPKTHRFDADSNSIVEKTEIEQHRVKTFSYSEERRGDYKPIGEQLDQLWHAMDIGVLPMVPAFYDPIKAVKDKYPKGEK